MPFSLAHYHSPTLQVGSFLGGTAWMASGTTVVQRWAEMSDTTLANADRVLVVLQKADLVLKSGRGGHKAAVHWDAPPLVNYAIAALTAFPVSEGPKEIARYRRLTPYQKSISCAVRDQSGKIVAWMPESHPYLTPTEVPFITPPLPPGFTPLLEGANFGEGFEWLLRLMADPTGEGRDLARRLSIQLHFHLGQRPAVMVAYAHENGDQVSETYVEPLHLSLTGFGLLSGMLSGPVKDATSTPPPSAPRHIVAVPFELLEGLADLLADTLAHQKQPPPVSSSGSGGAVPNASQGSGSENAGQNPPQNPPQGSKPASRRRTRRKGSAAAPSIPQAPGPTHPQSNHRDRAAAMPAAQEGRQPTRILSLLVTPHLSKVNPANDRYPEAHRRQHADR
ncbi:MAG: hypothetical protein INR62_11480, partial [Rhodospirillales bacterium]|nr:hypothetical protein [Acetobacter sp.]